MQKHFPIPRKLRNRANFILRINRAELGRLSNANYAGFVRVHFRLARDDRFHFVDVDLAITAANEQQLRAAREKLRRAAFVSLDVRVLMTDDAVKWLTK